LSDRLDLGKEGYHGLEARATGAIVGSGLQVLGSGKDQTLKLKPKTENRIIGRPVAAAIGVQRPMVCIPVGRPSPAASGLGGHGGAPLPLSVEQSGKKTFGFLGVGYLSWVLRM
jgi:hypothetical protein